MRIRRDQLVRNSHFEILTSTVSASSCLVTDQKGVLIQPPGQMHRTLGAQAPPDRMRITGGKKSRIGQSIRKVAVFHPRLHVGQDLKSLATTPADPAPASPCQRLRPRLRLPDRVLWVWLYRLWPGCLRTMLLVKPATVVQWHRQGFRLYWRWRSGSRGPGRPKVHREIRQLIRQMSAANPLWGAPRIHGEILKLGIQVGQATVGRYMVRRPNFRHRSGAASYAIIWTELPPSTCSWLPLRHFGSCT